MFAEEISLFRKCEDFDESKFMKKGNVEVFSDRFILIAVLLPFIGILVYKIDNIFLSILWALFLALYLGLAGVKAWRGRYQIFHIFSPFLNKENTRRRQMNDEDSY